MNKLGRTKEIIKLEDIKFKPNSLINLNIVVTGALEHFSRKNIEKLVKEKKWALDHDPYPVK